jgi:anti-sigma B factor antagonist
MFSIERNDDGRVVMAGRFDAAQVEAARRVFDSVGGACQVDFAGVDYISSAGLGVLLAAQRRLRAAGTGLRLAHLSPHLRDVFAIAGFDQLFEIE